MAKSGDKSAQLNRGRKGFRYLTYLLIGLGGTLILILGIAAAYLGVVRHNLATKIDQLKANQTSRFFAQYPPLKQDQVFHPKNLDALLQLQGYRETPSLPEISGTFYWQHRNSSSPKLIFYRPSFSAPGKQLESALIGVDFEQSEKGWILNQIQRLDFQESLNSAEIPPKEIGLFFAGRLRTQHSVSLSEIPVFLRFAVIAIEDAEFLKHLGLSVRGTLRALWKDLIAMKWVQGGSTITQQLMKNLFFSREKFITRKLKEAFYAFVAEASYEKEQLLEAYLNEVYLGQWGNHEIHGVSEAARYYFGIPVEEITLAQAATLAGMIQRPNYFDPRKRIEQTTQRRNLVLRRMLDSQFILPSEFRTARAETLKLAPEQTHLENAEYFMDLVLQKLPSSVRERLDKEPMTLYLTLDPNLQSATSRVLNAHLERMETSFKSLKENKEKGQTLQGAVIAIDVNNCQVLALNGGRSFQETEFNRVTAGTRQPGSLFKPFVYLSAFEADLDPPITPLTEIDDAPFEWKYEGQSWSPTNYDDSFRGKVTAKYALQNSINVATAKIAERVGIKSIVKNLRKAGIVSRLPVVPSLSLGSASVSPLEMAQAYTTLARLGNYCELNPISEIFDEKGDKVELPSASTSGMGLSPEATFTTVTLLKGVLTEGTAKLTQKYLDTSHMAGKTGTSNDFKDAWFVGFTPQFLALVWVGYDEKLPVEFPGATAALPIWIDLMRRSPHYYEENEDFTQPKRLENH